jgi:hypothetical protein
MSNIENNLSSINPYFVLITEETQTFIPFGDDPYLNNLRNYLNKCEVSKSRLCRYIKTEQGKMIALFKCSAPLEKISELKKYEGDIKFDIYTEEEFIEYVIKIRENSTKEEEMEIYITANAFFPDKNLIPKENI